MIIWSAIGIVTQIIAFYITELATMRFSIKQAIKEDNRATGLMILLLSISIS
jgi:putative membrane protein